MMVSPVYVFVGRAAARIVGLVDRFLFLFPIEHTTATLRLAECRGPDGFGFEGKELAGLEVIFDEVLPACLTRIRRFDENNIGCLPAFWPFDFNQSFIETLGYLASLIFIAITLVLYYRAGLR